MVIVGLDPGTTIGVAIIDTQGEIIKLASMREASKNQVISFISKFGRPILIASDVSPPPKMVERLAASIGCSVYFPEFSMSNIEKQRMVKEYKELIDNAHQKDALAAAIKAFRNYHGLFLKIGEVLERQGRKPLFGKVVKRMIKERDENIADTIKKVLKR